MKRPFIYLLVLIIGFEGLIYKVFPVAISVFIKYGSEVLIYILTIYYVIKSVLKHKKWIISPIDGPLIMLIIVSIFSALINNVSFLSTVFALRIYLRFVCVFYLIFLMKINNEFSHKIIHLLITIAVIQASFGLFQLLGGESVKQWFVVKGKSLDIGIVNVDLETASVASLGLFGSMIHYNIFGIFLTIFYSFCLASLLYSKKNLLNIVITLILCLVIMLSGSRSSTMAMLLGSIVILVFFKNKNPQKYLILVLILLLIPLSLLLSNGNDSFTRSVEAIQNSNILAPTINNNFRLYLIYEVVKETSKDHLFLGFGPGMFADQYAISRGFDIIFTVLNIPHDVICATSDVEWAKIYGQIGLLGIISWSYLFLNLFRWIINIITSDYATEKLLMLATGCLGMVVIVVVSGFFIPVLEVKQTALMFWLLLGLLFQKDFNERKSLDKI